MSEAPLEKIHMMREGATLLVKGPASISLQSGKASVFMADLPLKRRFIIPEGRMMPITAHEDCLIQIVIGSSGSMEEVEENTIPKDWIQILLILKRILKDEGTVIVFGGIDLGKSSLSTLLTNYFTSTGLPVSILDLDVGQSDIGLPATIGLGKARNPIKGLYEAEPSAIYFVGSITPAPMTGKILKGTERLAEMARRDKRTLIVNTDGWIQGEDALNYKIRLVETLRPEAAVIIGGESEIDSLMERIKDKTQVLKVRKPSFIYKRTREERKRIREKTYYRYLKNGVLRTFPLSIVRWSHRCFEELSGDRMNLLVGLIDGEGFMLGPGIIKRIDRSKGKALVYSPEIRSPVQKIEVGLIRIKENGCEIGQMRLNQNCIKGDGNSI